MKLHEIKRRIGLAIVGMMLVATHLHANPADSISAEKQTQRIGFRSVQVDAVTMLFISGIAVSLDYDLLCLSTRTNIGIRTASTNNEYVHLFAKKLVDYRLSHFTEGWHLKPKSFHDADNPDKISVISFNWDIILDNAFGAYMNEKKLITSIQGVDRSIFMDYCMFDYQLKNYLDFPSSLRIKPMGFANLKYLKLHGSMNWFQCPGCSAVFINLGSPNSKTPSMEERVCRLCNDNELGTHTLRRYYVSPTMLKNFRRTHFGSIWWNAGYEIAEAKKIVFMGYSLPMADYEFKYLINKNLGKDVNIQVVLHNKAKDYTQSRNNYKKFFGDRLNKNSIYRFGVMQYIEELHLGNLLCDAP